MTEYRREKPSSDCPPPHRPADQPKAPNDECCEVVWPCPPKWHDPDPCEPADCCECPTHASGPNCLETLIAEQTECMTNDVTAAEKAKAFKDELDNLLKSAKEAKKTYTPDKYKQLVEYWQKQDECIADLIRKLVCAVPCWRCIIECYVCKQINEMHLAEERLNGKIVEFGDVYNLYDKRYWHERDRDAKQRHLDRIKLVVGAWEKPVTTIETAQKAIKDLIETACKGLCSEPGKVVFDVFLRLVPIHLSIAPPQSEKWTTAIDKKYTEFCSCDESHAKFCCGPNVGLLSIRQRLNGPPRPYLIHPDLYYELICCLVKMSYRPARDALADALAALKNVEDEIQRSKTRIEDGFKTFVSWRDSIPSAVDCCDYEKHDDESQGAVAR